MGCRQLSYVPFDRLTFFATEGLRRLRHAGKRTLTRIGVGHKTPEFELGAANFRRRSSMSISTA
jgi:hypothetical protein